MKPWLTRGRIAWLVVLSVLIVDQIVKVWIKTHLYWHESIRITDWFYIYFTENNGMAFGLEIFGKLFLTLFRVVAVGAILWFLYKAVRLRMKMGFVACLALVFAGAVGNIIDSVCYGVVFSESTHHALATFLPEGGGYAPWFFGKVVDMFYFPIIDTEWPDWMPLVGGDRFVFFSPIFNVADASISCGVIALLIFYHGYLSKAYHDAVTSHKQASTAAQVPSDQRDTRANASTHAGNHRKEKEEDGEKRD